MGQIRRHDEGPVVIDVRLLDDLEWALGVHDAPSRSRVKPLADEVRARYAAGEDPHQDGALVSALLTVRDEFHVYLELLQLDALQRLRGWHRLRYGTITVEAAYLCEVRNLLDSLTMSIGSSCEDELEALKSEGLDDRAARASGAIAAGRCCDECEWCQFLALRDRCDDALDASGHYGSSYYQAYGRPADRREGQLTVPVHPEPARAA
jgi:hypothetical protein